MRASAPVAILLALLLPGCEPGGDVPEGTAQEGQTEQDREIGDSGPDTVGGSACEQQFLTASEDERVRDAPDRLDAAITTCLSLEEWHDAAARYPEVVDGDPEAFLRERCAAVEDPRVADSQLCTAATGGS